MVLISLFFFLEEAGDFAFPVGKSFGVEIVVETGALGLKDRDKLGQWKAFKRGRKAGNSIRY